MCRKTRTRETPRCGVSHDLAPVRWASRVRQCLTRVVFGLVRRFLAGSRTQCDAGSWRAELRSHFVLDLARHPARLPGKYGQSTMQIGYCRTSTAEQVAGFEVQEQKLVATGCTRLFREQVSSVAVRAELDAALDFVREGDTLVVTRLDRLARSTTDLLGIVATLERKGVSLRILDFGGSEVDTQSPTGRMLLTMFAAVAEFERGVMLERQRAGIAKAKADGRYRGRAPTARAKSEQVRALASGGAGANVIAAQLSISRASVYRILADDRASPL